MIVRTLASGSSGNSILVSAGRSAVLVDAGISCRKITTRLKDCGLTPGELEGILITHEHSDHVAGLPVLLKKWKLPIYATEGTCAVLAGRCPDLAPYLMIIPSNGIFELGGMTVTSFPTPHDAVESVGYILSDGTKTAAIATDLGEVTACVKDRVTGADLVLLEANHDIPTLRTGPYPYALQERILSGVGHLCNEAAAAFAVHLAKNGTQTFLLAHLSKENNTPELARAAVCGALEEAGLSPEVYVAPRDALSDVFEL